MENLGALVNVLCFLIVLFIFRLKLYYYHFTRRHNEVTELMKAIDALPEETRRDQKKKIVLSSLMKDILKIELRRINSKREYTFALDLTKWKYRDFYKEDLSFEVVNGVVEKRLGAELDEQK